MCQDQDDHYLSFHCSDSEMPYNEYFMLSGKARKQLKHAPIFLHLQTEYCTLFSVTINCLVNGKNSNP